MSLPFMCVCVCVFNQIVNFLLGFSINIQSSTYSLTTGRPKQIITFVKVVSNFKHKEACIILQSFIKLYYWFASSF